MLKVAWSPEYNHPLPENHRFPMVKYDLIREQLLYEGTISESHLFSTEVLEDEWILSTHESEYLRRLNELTLPRPAIRRIGFPLSEAIVKREKIIARAAVQCSLYALQYGISMNTAGGTHHAFHDRGEGFCIFNDIAIAANYLLSRGMCNRVLVVDLDVHQGNGTAAIFQHDPRVFTFSMHNRHNYPFQKESSDLDVGLEDGVGDQGYLEILQKNLDEIMEKFHPDFVIFQSGVDVLEGDRLGRLRLTIEGCKRRDRLVLEVMKKGRVPVMICMGGGYSVQLRRIVEAHANTFREAQDLFF